MFIRVAGGSIEREGGGVTVRRATFICSFEGGGGGREAVLTFSGPLFNLPV